MCGEGFKKEVPMKTLGKILAAATLVVAGACLLGNPQFAASPHQMADMPHEQASDEPIPTFHTQAPKDALPPTMEPSLFTNMVVANAYTAAGRVKKVLYQEPCYCHCDRSMGHGSLLDCFVNRHGSECDTCMKEALYAYEQTHKGKTPAQIREGIIHGDWQQLDLAKYQTAHLPAANSPAK
jgi:hypothetical protein